MSLQRQHFLLSHLKTLSVGPAVDCKTVGFSLKSVKKSVKRAVRVLGAQSARASHARRDIRTVLQSSPAGT